MATRPFTPTSFGIDATEFYARQVEYRLGHSGEYVRHLHQIGLPQWVVVDYQHIPIDASVTPDYALSATNPKLWGYLPHFDDSPKAWTRGNSVRPDNGSRFEIRGLLFAVKSVKVNHRGGLHCDLEILDNCAVARPEFIIERDAFLCLDERPCADI